MHFAVDEDKHKLGKVIEQFEFTFVGKINETYERFVFNSRDQKERESIEQYIIALRTLTIFVHVLKNPYCVTELYWGLKKRLRKKLFQGQKLTLSKALDICRSSETTT